MTAQEAFDAASRGGFNDLAFVLALCRKHGDYCVSGDLAVNTYVRPVFTMDADIVIAAADAPEPLVSRDAVEHAMADRAGRTLLIIDIGMPRDCDPAVGDVDGVTYYDLDDLQARWERERASLNAVGDYKTRLDALRVEVQVMLDVGQMLADQAHGVQAAFIVCADLLALTLLQAPGEFGADIVEAQAGIGEQHDQVEDEVGGFLAGLLVGSVAGEAAIGQDWPYITIEVHGWGR